MKIAFIRTYDFPLGGAPQNRALGICRGLIEQGWKVEVHVYAPGRLNLAPNRKKFQVYESVPIFNHSWKWSPAKGKTSKIFGIFEGMIRTFISLIKSNRKESYDWIFLNNNKNFYALPFYIISRLFGARFGRELNEFPLFILNPQKYHPIQKFISMKTNYLWFDDFLIMTNKLIEFYRPLARKKARFMLLPMTVDMDRFPNPVTGLDHSWDITYCGDLSQKKDGVLHLIKAFAMIKDEYPKCRLKLIGQNKSKNYMNKLEKTISDLGIGSRVLLTGFVMPEQIPDYLYDSRLLVLSRPDSKQAQGGFPTKLGEYLSTGVPVAVTKVGEIQDYLRDGQNAFLAEAGNISSFADAMRRALCDKKISDEVGLAGRDTAIKNFSHSVQGGIIVKFLRRKV